MTAKSELMRKAYSGIYSPDDAAVFLRATTPPPKVPLNRWENQRKRFIGPSTRHIYSWIRVSRTDKRADQNIALTFEELVRARMIVLFRARGLSLQAILHSEDYIRSLTKKPQPFVTEELWSSSSDMFFEFEKSVLAATRPGQLVMDDVIREFMTPIHHRLSFDEDGMSCSWRPMPGILIDPGLQFGAPCIEGTRIETEAIWSFRQSGTPPEELAELYQVQTADIEAALAWEETLARAA